MTAKKERTVRNMDLRIADLEVQIVGDDPENYLAEASIDIVKGDAVLVYVRMRGLDHHDDGSIMFMRSDDEGGTWDPSSLVEAMPEYDNWGFTSASVKILKNGTIMVLAHAMVVDSNLVHGANFRGAWSTISTDGGCTWTTPEPLLAWPMRIISIWDNPVELDDGRLLLAVSGHIRDTDVSNSFSDPSRSCLLCSENNGRSWYCRGTIAFDPAGIHRFYEPGMTLTDDGRLIALSRQHYAEYCSNAPAGFLFSSESTDMGASWSGFQQTEIWGYPADTVTLHSGFVLNAYGHRRDPQSVRIAVSSDGKNWSNDNVFTIYSPPRIPELEDSKGNAMNTGYRHIGYPSAAVRADGSVVVVFHSFNEERRQIVLSASFRVDAS
ncbi:MAG: exo-alpha-sialidase [Lentisphaerae bacterium]|jgi:hypothetical protein|nr:exo-alpha-sialidase [Lentisphaerota bacterium]MBT4818996.1 exo-alpha-sialidase [Lentisphaerota bacterium]MBT5611158.1 exo-alpha-sialidase [Lentisphaerota bacterium]MBT7054718.1 exo-alpha-sialidase [Lentisphaerota bacterium]MBT7841976.1 exo-alpha-sialidase [Lentisphaerota bacterium]